MLNPVPDTYQQPFDFDSNTCIGCLRKNAKGLTIHKKSCKGERAEEAQIKGLEPMFLVWENEGRKLQAKEKKKWRDCIRVWLLKRMKQELNLGLASENPRDVPIEDDSHIHEVLVLAGKTVVPCLCGDHSDCVRNSSGCGGDHAAPDYSTLPSQQPLGEIPRQTTSWLNSVVDAVLSKEAVQTLVVNGRKAKTSLVESVHRQIRLPVAKGRVHQRIETALVKSGSSSQMRV